MEKMEKEKKMHERKVEESAVERGGQKCRLGRADRLRGEEINGGVTENR